MSRRRTSLCPTCGARGVPIVYGMPGIELFEKAERGEIVLGGCVIDGEMPTHACEGEHRWSETATR